MKIDSTITISVILALCAIISPVITAFINNSHQFKMKKLELEQQRYDSNYIHMREVFESYFKAASQFLRIRNGQSELEYMNWLQQALLYIPSDIRADVFTADEKLRRRSDDAELSLISVSVSLNEFLLKQLPIDKSRKHKLCTGLVSDGLGQREDS